MCVCSRHRHFPRGISMLRPALAAGLAGLVLVSSHTARAGTVTETLSGTRLELHLACPAEVKIEPGADLHGKIEDEARAAHQPELDRLRLSGGTVAAIEQGGACEDDAHVNFKG